jgi:hypothetical protein
MNGNGLPHDHSFRLHRVSCYDDLERIFAEDHAEDLDNDDDEDDLASLAANAASPTPSVFSDLIDFAEKYFNMHPVNAPYPSAITKTVNMVRRKSLSVSCPAWSMVIANRRCPFHTRTLNATACIH